MVLNRASRKEAERRFAALHKPVTIHVFTHRFEDAACRETRQVAEELAETSNRLSVEINEATSAGDLLRKYRIDSVPALVVTGKDMPELRAYGVPLAYGFDAFLDAILTVASPMEVEDALAEKLSVPRSAAAAADGVVHAGVHVDLVASRRDPAVAEAAVALWRLAAAERAVVGSVRLVPALRIAEDCAPWVVAAGSGAFPAVLVGGKRVLSWPFTEMDLANAVM